MKLVPKRKQPETGRHRITPSSRPVAFSYHASRLEQNVTVGRQQPRDQAVRRRERLVRYWRQRIGVLAALIIIAGCILDILLLSPSPRIISLAQSSNDYFLQSSNVYQQAAAKLFADSMFNGNKVTINTAAIAGQLERQFPELSDVSVTLPLIGHRPIVYIAPTTPGVVLNTAGSSFLLNNNGKALVTASKISNPAQLKLPIVTDASNVAIKLNSTALPSSSIAFIQSVNQQFSAKNIAIDSITLSAEAYEVDVKPNGVGYYVKFNMHNNTARQQAGTYFAVKQRLAAENIVPSSYIDVRVDGRAYYK